MKDLKGRAALLTGASGGLGGHLAGALARAGVDLALVGYPGHDLEPVRLGLGKEGGRVITLAADLRDPSHIRFAVEETLRQLGRLDILINNAGVEVTAPYHELSEDFLDEAVAVNLAAPMQLTWMALPGMLERRCGHIVNMSSLAGKSGPACQEPYAATKAALIAFTYSLRATYRGTGVSASAIVPGFVEAGIYSRIKQRTGYCAPRSLGTSTPERVARAMIRGIRSDRPEVIINPVPVRPLLAIIALFPSLGEWLAERFGGSEFFRRVAAAMSRLRG